MGDDNGWRPIVHRHTLMLVWITASVTAILILSVVHLLTI